MSHDNTQITGQQAGSDNRDHPTSVMPLDATLKKLDFTLEQQTATAISGMSLPSFSGSSHEDVHDFLAKFKLVTFALSEKHRCLALNKSLCGTANIWAKTNIKKHIVNGNWKAIKKALIDRFGSSDTSLRYQIKLGSMRYNPKESITLLGYAESYLNAHVKAFKEQSEKAGILSLKLNLPNHVIRSLNILDDGWHKYEEYSKIYALIKRYEENILPYEAPDNEKEKYLDSKLIIEMLNQLRKDRLEDVKETKAAVAVMAATKPIEKPKDPEQYRYRKPEYKRKFNNSYQRSNNWHPQNYKRPRFGHSETLALTNELQGNPKPSTSKQSGPNDPPYPCRMCGANHFHKDCPTRNNDLK